MIRLKNIVTKFVSVCAVIVMSTQVHAAGKEGSTDKQGSADKKVLMEIGRAHV